MYHPETKYSRPFISLTPIEEAGNYHLSDPEIVLNLEFIAHQTWTFLQKHLDANTGLPFDRVELRDNEARLSKITSPSNIGLALLSCVAADQLNYLSSVQSLAQVRLLVASIKILKTRQGVLVNWHHSDSCQPVIHWPNDSGEKCEVEEFVSSVDNAWLAAGLLIAGDYFPKLKSAINEILDQMNFTIFFDEESNSFAGGIHQNGHLTDYHYPSNFLSETRILYYVSYFLGQISRETLLRYLNHFPQVSYGGSMFEALMPLLVFDEQDLSLDAILNLIYLQQEAGKTHGYWGFSPCDDPEDTYKEFGVGEYKRNGFDVITPHALLLALPYAPTEVLAILQKLTIETEAWSENGYVDAVNIRRKKTSESWLFLDQAMIFLSVYQCLIKNNFRKRIC